MVISAESVAYDCQQKNHKKWKDFTSAFRNIILVIYTNIKIDSSGLSKNTATEISSAVLIRSIFSQKDKGKFIFEHFTNLGKHRS